MADKRDDITKDALNPKGDGDSGVTPILDIMAENEKQDAFWQETLSVLRERINLVNQGISRQIQSSGFQQ